MTTLETLKAARNLIDKPENWTQVELARDAKGNDVYPTDPEAHCYCMMGALRRVVGESGNYEREKNAIRPFIPKFVSLGDFNDTHTHAEVLAAFDAAIAKLEAA